MSMIINNYLVNCAKQSVSKKKLRHLCTMAHSLTSLGPKRMAFRKIYCENLKGRSTCCSPQKIQVFTLFNLQFLLTMLKYFKIVGVKIILRNSCEISHVKHLYL